MFLEGPQELLHPFPVRLSHQTHVAGEGSRPGEPGQGRLEQGGSREIRDLFSPGELPDDRLRGRHPTDAKTGKQHLAGGPDVDHVPSPGQATESGGRGLIVEELPIEIVLDQGNLVAHGQPHQGLPPGHGETAAGGVLERGHHVDHLGTLASDDRFHLLYQDPVRIHRNRDHPGPVPPKDLEGSVIAGRLHQDRVSGAQENTTEKIQGLLGAVHHQELTLLGLHPSLIE